MGLSRREFAAMMTGAAGGVAFPFLFQRWRPLLGRPEPVQVFGPEAYFQWRALTDRVWLAQGGGGNSLVYIGRRGALGVDAKSFGLGRPLYREAVDHGVLLTHLVLTHHHADHCGGSEAFTQAVRLAHRKAEPRILDTAAASLERGAGELSALRARLVDSGVSEAVISEVHALSEALDDLSPEDFGPTETFEGEHGVDLGGPPVQLHWVSEGHTDGDTFLYFPEDNVLHCGDLLFQGRHPYVDVGAGATPRGWIRCIEAMLEHCDAETVIVPGHGGVTDRAGLRTQMDYFLRLQAIVEGGRAEGLSREEIQATDVDDFRTLAGGREHLARNLGIVFDELEPAPGTGVVAGPQPPPSRQGSPNRISAEETTSDPASTTT
jgi:glyoxylase-like metal-dependent hydrolase (beta-lactamase superfamily II)